MYSLDFVQIVIHFPYNKIFMFQIYLIFIILFLIPICCLILIEVSKLLLDNIGLNFFISSSKYTDLQKNEVLSLAKIYINKKQWLFCILMLEFYISIDAINIAEYNNIIGFCYQFISVNHLAKKYYIQASQASPTNILFLNNLAKINIICEDFNEAMKIYNKVLEIDSMNKSALDNLILLNNRIEIQ